MLQPNKAHLWVNCPLSGSVMVSGNYTATPHAQPFADSDDARREGTCAHWAAELLLRGEVEKARDLIGMKHANGWIVDEEMAWHVANYAAYVRSFGPYSAIEKGVELFGLIRGRLDTVNSASHTLRIFDFKYGYRLVESEHNFNMLCYGLAEAFTANGAVPLELHVYQPRPHHPDGIARVWKIAADELAVWWQWLYEKARACFLPEPPGLVGKHCLDCPAAGSCHALNANTYAIYETVISERMTDYTPDQMAAMLTFLEMATKIVEAKRKAIRAEAEARISRGTRIPGWGMEPRKGNRAWFVTPAQRQLATGHDPFKQVEKSPAEMEREGVPKDTVNKLSSMPTIGRKLTDDPASYIKRLFKD